MRTLSKKRWKWMLVPALAAVLILALAGLALAAGPRSGQQAQNANQAGTITTPTPASGTLTDTQEDEILYLLEEEKLAGDVYEYLYAEYGVRVFKNIAASEDRHAKAVRTLTETYGLDDTLLEVGKFNDPDLQALYDQLIKQGSQSITDAYAVGVLIEETDIDDLKALLDDPDGLPADVEQVLTNLLNGSYNHLAAFQR